MANRALWLSLFIILFFTACRKGINGITPEMAEEYFPLAVGNEWEYDYVLHTSAGQTIMQIHTMTVTGTKEVNGEEYYELSAPEQLIPFSPIYLRFHDKQLVDPFGNVEISFENPDTPFRVDTLYSGTEPMEAVAVVEMTLLSDRQSVSVAAGDFSCLVISTTLNSLNPGLPSSDSETLEYYAEGVGLVQRTVQYTHSGGRVELFLRAYQVE